jgi:hypothetical protein
MKYLFTILLFLNSLSLFAQQTVRACFLGNSYTYVNNLPQAIADVALSTGDTLIFDGNTPGGYTLQLHSVDQTSLNKIMIGGWDYVVLQEQSQLPSFPIGQVMTDVFPYATYLDSIINAYNPCGETMFYMTWGRKNGDSTNCQFYPPLCTYNGMDSLLRLRYTMMADSNQAVLSPVGAVWHYIRQQFPLIELYQSDESHPSVAGTYAAACCFYTVMFRKDPTLITYDFTLNATDASNIRSAAKIMVYDSLSNWNIGNYDPVADFNYTVQTGNQITFNNLSTNSTTYTWYFGDGDSSSLTNPVHIYPFGGATYQVILIASHCNKNDTVTISVQTGASGIINNKCSSDFIFSPNPTSGLLTVQSLLFLKDQYEIKITDASGKKIYSGTCEHSIGQHLDLSIHPHGIYFISVLRNKQNICTYKITK